MLADSLTAAHGLWMLRILDADVASDVASQLDPDTATFDDVQQTLNGLLAERAGMTVDEFEDRVLVTHSLITWLQEDA